MPLPSCVRISCSSFPLPCPTRPLVCPTALSPVVGQAPLPSCIRVSCLPGGISYPALPQLVRPPARSPVVGQAPLPSCIRASKLERSYVTPLAMRNTGSLRWGMHAWAVGQVSGFGMVFVLYWALHLHRLHDHEKEIAQIASRAEVKKKQTASA